MTEPEPRKRVLVCGGRDFLDGARVGVVLSAIEPGIIIEGCARGADALAEDYARAHGVPIEHYPANWERDGRAAGYIRNRRMLAEGKPDIVVAFPGGRGTADMVRQATIAGVAVISSASAFAETLRPR